MAITKDIRHLFTHTHDLDAILQITPERDLSFQFSFTVGFLDRIDWQPFTYQPLYLNTLNMIFLL